MTLFGCTRGFRLSQYDWPQERKLCEVHSDRGKARLRGAKARGGVTPGAKCHPTPCYLARDRKGDETPMLVGVAGIFDAGMTQVQPEQLPRYKGDLELPGSCPGFRSQRQGAPTIALEQWEQGI